MKKSKIKRLIIVAVIFILLTAIPTSYNLVSPGAIENIGPMVQVSDNYQTSGEIMLAAVTVRRARPIHFLYVKLLQPEYFRLEPAPEIDMREYFALMQEMMTESQLTAKAVALKAAGYEPEISGQGAKIIEVLEYSDAYNKLEPDDIIVAINDQPVELLTDVREKVKESAIGDKVAVRVLRDDEEIEVRVVATNLEEGSDIPALGVLITSYQREVKLPIEIDIDAGQIGGPSAGSMFALEIYNQLTEEDITRGYKIAGTGSIDLRGNVAQIDGIRQKIKSAADEGVDIFFYPGDNQADIKDLGNQFNGVRLIKVDNFEQIIAYLKDL